MIPQSLDYKCGYLQAKVKAIKSFMLTRNDLKSLINSPNVKNAFTILAQYAYYRDIVEKSATIEDFEKNAILKDASLFKILSKIAPPDLAKILELKASRLLLSAVEPEIELLLKENDFEGILKKAPDKQANLALTIAIKEYEKSGQLFTFRRSLEQYFYENMLKFANKDIASLITKEIDYYNVITCLKAKNIGMENLLDVIIPLGLTKPAELISCIEAGSFDGLDINTKNIEVEFEKRLLLKAHRAFYAYPLSQLTTYSFTLLKEFETKNIARILIGIQQRMDPEDILKIVAL